MKKFFMNCLLNNLKIWMEVEESQRFRDIYFRMYLICYSHNKDEAGDNGVLHNEAKVPLSPVLFLYRSFHDG